MNDPTIETDIADILKDLQKGQKESLISLETIKGDIKALDTKVEQLDKRILARTCGEMCAFVLRLASAQGLLSTKSFSTVEYLSVCCWLY